MRWLFVGEFEKLNENLLHNASEELLSYCFRLHFVMINKQKLCFGFVGKRMKIKTKARISIFRLLFVCEAFLCELSILKFHPSEDEKRGDK